MSDTRKTMNGTFFVLGLALVIAIGTPLVAGADPTDPKVFGKTYGEWSADWWSWALSFPAATSPFFAEGEMDCSAGQFGKLWHLAGNFGGVSDRSCDIDNGRALLFPILTQIGIAFPGETEEEGREATKAAEDNPELLECTVDDEPCIFTTMQVRTQSPAFGLEIIEGSFLADILEPFGFEPGDVMSPSIVDGHWVLLAPLPPGEHELVFKGITNSGFEVDVTYHLSVD